MGKHQISDIDLRSIFESFETGVDFFISYSSIKHGHINDTFLITTEQKQYVLQRKNNLVFKKPLDIIHNIVQLNNDLLILTKSNSPFLKRSDGIWVLMKFISGMQPKVDSIQELKLCAKAIAEFHNNNLKIPIENFKITIPNFHNIKYRYDLLEASVLKNSASRLKDCLKVVNELLSVKNKFVEYYEQITAECPLRICHNDSKIENILIDKNSSVLIDLDTIMPGYLAFDYGDAVRSFIGTQKEDDDPVPETSIQDPRIKAFYSSFIHSLKLDLSSAELQYLELAPAYMSYIMSIRFITDYLINDVYFKIQYPEQNLRRAINQIKLGNQLNH